MKIKMLGLLALVLTTGMLLPQLSRASGGIMAIPDGTYTVEGQDLKITIENGVVTVTRDKDIVKIGDYVEITGPIETRRIETNTNAIIGETGVAASGGITAVPPPVTIQNTTVDANSFTTKFFRKFGVQ